MEHVATNPTSSSSWFDFSGGFTTPSKTEILVREAFATYPESQLDLKTKEIIQALVNFEVNPDWSTAIDPEIELGVAGSDFQLNGPGNFPFSTWKKWEEDGHVTNGDISDKGLDYINHPEKLIEALDKLGCPKHYRFSIEWSAIVPQKGLIDQEALEKYRVLIKLLKAHGYEPNATIHHFSEPQWFLDEGGFENEENIQYIVDFAKIIYTEFSSVVKEWVTFNEPGVYAFMGYFLGEFPPGGRDLTTYRCGCVLKNLLIAHSAIYDALKAIDNSTQIGITHQALRFRAANSLTSYVCDFMTHMVHGAAMNFFKTGEFEFRMPFFSLNSHITYSKPDLQYDFLGLQYYTVPLIGFTGSTCNDYEKMTHMPFRLYPQGLAGVLTECCGIKKPIIFTETGAATNEEDQREHIEKALKVVSAARKYLDVTGVYVWSFIDNKEWAHNYTKKFGIMTKEGELKLAAEFFKKLILASKEGQALTLQNEI